MTSFTRHYMPVILFFLLSSMIAQNQVVFSNEYDTSSASDDTKQGTVDVEGITSIPEIQGAGHTSPFLNQTVTTVGIVTAIDRDGGFWIQDPIGDGNDNTSDGLYVFADDNLINALGLRVGDEVRLRDTINEYRRDPDDLTLTQMAFPDVEILSRDNDLPVPVVLGNGGRPIPNVVIDNDRLATFDPDEDGMDFYESLEGMRVQVNDPRVVASRPAGDYDGFGERAFVADNGVNSNSNTPRGGIALGTEPGGIEDLNPEVMLMDDSIIDTPDTVQTGDRLSTVVGVMDYTFSDYKIQITQPVTVTPGTLSPEVTTLIADDETLTIASYNVENLDPSDGSRFDLIAAQIADNLQCPDILAVQEIQDNNAMIDNGTTDASMTYQMLIDAIMQAGCGTYDYRDIAPLDNQDGGAPGSNIRVGYIFNPERVDFLDRGNAGPTDAVEAVMGPDGVQLTHSPGRVNPTHVAYNSEGNSRKPLAAEFVFNNQTIFLINHHFSSKFGDEALYGVPPQEFAREPLRVAQAQLVADLAAQILALDPGARVAVLGDTNEFYFRPPVATLEAAGLTNLWNILPENERYNYEFDNYSQVLDHILVSEALFNTLVGYDAVHINAEYVDQISDHDPLLAAFKIDAD